MSAFMVALMLMFAGPAQQPPHTVAEYEAILKREPGNAVAMFNLACVYAQMNEKDKALEWLRQAVAPANKAFYFLDLNDPDLASLHDDPRYRELVQSVDKLRSPCMYNAEARQFDFWVGEWDAYGQGRKAGTSVIQRISNGCGILENWTNAVGGGGGKSINFYDPNAGKWFQYWIGADGNPHRFSGTYRDGAMRFDGESLTRLTLFNIDSNTVRQLSERSDDGKNWSVVYDFKYVRRTPYLRTSALKINVIDIDAAIAFYADKLGFAIADRSGYPHDVALKTNDDVQLILHKVARLQQPGSQTQAGLTLQVNNLDQAIERMKTLNVPFAETSPRKEAVGNAISIVTPSGMRISMMHETVVHNEPFVEPRIYNFGVLVPDMAAAREFYSRKLGFVVRSENYLPLDLPLGHPDGSFAFMLHVRPGVTATRSEDPPFITMVFETPDLERTIAELKRSGVAIVSQSAKRVAIRDPFGNVSEIVEKGRLDKLYEEKRYLELRDATEPFYRAVAARALNQPQASMQFLDEFIAKAGDDDEHLIDAYALRADDAAMMFDYAKAADDYRALLERFRSRLTADELADFENQASLYSALRDVPPQHVSATAGRLNAPHEGPGWLVPVEANGQRVALGLDTGANMSLLIRSVAEKLGVKILEQSISVGTVTSLKVKPRLGYLPLMKLGNVTVENATFIILDDQLMTFPDGTVIQGVIGFPVIAALGNVSFHGDGSVTAAPADASKGAPNMFLYGKDIVFDGEYRNRSMPFLLDTGAERTMLYQPFLHAYEKEIAGKFPLRPEKFTGVGGTEEVPAYVLPDFNVTFSGAEARLPEARVLTKALTDKGGIFYGNIGGDLLKRFDTVTLDFASMRAAFSEGVDFASSRWKLADPNARIEPHLGRNSLFLRSGAASLGDASFQDGVIDVDIATTSKQSFVGIIFRAQNDDDFEIVYFRPFKSGQPDAVQYTPSFNGSAAWQLYSGPGYTAATDIPHDEWMHARIEVSGITLKVYLGDMEKPVLVNNDLRRGYSKGSLGLWGIANGGYFSNFRYRAAVAEPARPLPPMTFAPGTLTKWELSEAFTAAERDPEKLPDVSALHWQTVGVETPGMVVIDRYRRGPDKGMSSQRTGARPERGLVFARTTIESDRDRVQRMSFGYSDEVTVFLNGRPIYTGRSAFRYRDPSFLGIMDVENDAVYLPLKKGKNELVLAVA
ncbi:MAG TPA: aspartyl protease family protein, partial [Thermoanaerobaculia bacterium]|nr:aspartyl protease family protein [Thermoanaerobaculia bacterium]